MDCLRGPRDQLITASDLISSYPEILQLPVPLSVIVPVYRDADALARTLADTDFSGAELIVATVSDDDSLAPLRHAHPRIVKVIRREAARAIHLSNLYHNTYQGPLARKLASWSGLDRVFFANSGTEAVDGAMKLARLFAHKPEEGPGTAAKKHRFLALENSFHGRTFGAISVTSPEKYRLPFAPVVPGADEADPISVTAPEVTRVSEEPRRWPGREFT